MLLLLSSIFALSPSKCDEIPSFCPSSLLTQCTACTNNKPALPRERACSSREPCPEGSLCLDGENNPCDGSSVEGCFGHCAVKCSTSQECEETSLCAPTPCTLESPCPTVCQVPCPQEALLECDFGIGENCELVCPQEETPPIDPTPTPCHQDACPQVECLIAPPACRDLGGAPLDNSCMPTGSGSSQESLCEWEYDPCLPHCMCPDGSTIHSGQDTCPEEEEPPIEENPCKGECSPIACLRAPTPCEELGGEPIEDSCVPVFDFETQKERCEWTNAPCQPNCVCPDGSTIHSEEDKCPEGGEPPIEVNPCEDKCSPIACLRAPTPCEELGGSPLPNACVPTFDVEGGEQRCEWSNSPCQPNCVCPDGSTIHSEEDVCPPSETPCAAVLCARPCGSVGEHAKNCVVREAEARDAWARSSLVDECCPNSPTGPCPVLECSVCERLPVLFLDNCDVSASRDQCYRVARACTDGNVVANFETCPVTFTCSTDNTECPDVCPATPCAAPPAGCSYDHSLVEQDECGCDLGCGPLVCCGSEYDIESDVAADVPVFNAAPCALPYCPPLREGCEYGPPRYDDCGCQLTCGEVQCWDDTDDTDGDLEPCNERSCPQVRCAAPPRGCEWVDPVYDRCGCPINPCSSYTCCRPELFDEESGSFDLTTTARLDCPELACPELADPNCVYLDEEPVDPCGCPTCPRQQCGCGGFAGIPCRLDEKCIDNPEDDCDPLRGGADCPGICVPKHSPCVCPEIWSPVCGSDGNTYSNECRALCMGVTAFHRGECKPETPPEDCICTLQYDPVCGANGKTYGNACQARCDGQLYFREGECPDTDGEDTPTDGTDDGLPEELEPGDVCPRERCANRPRPVCATGRCPGDPTQPFGCTGRCVVNEAGFCSWEVLLFHEVCDLEEGEPGTEDGADEPTTSPSTDEETDDNVPPCRCPSHLRELGLQYVCANGETFSSPCDAWCAGASDFSEGACCDFVAPECADDEVWVPAASGLCRTGFCQKRVCLEDCSDPACCSDIVPADSQLKEALADEEASEDGEASESEDTGRQLCTRLCARRDTVNFASRDYARCHAVFECEKPSGDDDGVCVRHSYVVEDEVDVDALLATFEDFCAEDAECQPEVRRTEDGRVVIVVTTCQPESFDNFVTSDGSDGANPSAGIHGAAKLAAEVQPVASEGSSPAGITDAPEGEDDESQTGLIVAIVALVLLAAAFGVWMVVSNVRSKSKVSPATEGRVQLATVATAAEGAPSYRRGSHARANGAVASGTRGSSSGRQVRRSRSRSAGVVR